MSFELNEKAMLVKLSISQWIGNKCDKKISLKISEDYNAHIDSGRYNKMLVSLNEIKNISKIVNSTRTFHYKNSLPWGDDKERLLPITNFNTYTEKMRKFKSDFEDSVQEVISNYENIKNTAKIRLADMFNENDYPDKETLIEKYGFNLSINPIPISCDFRVSLQKEEIKAIKSTIENKFQESINKAMIDLWQKLFDQVKHMSDKLNNDESILRDSLIINLTNMCSILPNLNILNDPKLERMRLEIEDKLCSHNTQSLRDNEFDRKKLGNISKNISNEINELIEKSTYKKELEDNKNIDILNSLDIHEYNDR